MADDQSEYSEKMEEDLKLWSHRYLVNSIRFTPAQHPALGHPPAGHNLGFPADIAVRLPDSPDHGGAQWIPRDALLYAEEQFARGADGAEPLPKLHSAAPPIAEILADARIQPVYWVDHGNGFPNTATEQAGSATQQTLVTTSGSQLAFNNTQPVGLPSSLPIRTAQNGSESSLDALDWTFTTQQPARNVYTQVSGESYWFPQEDLINYTFISGQPWSQPDDTLSLNTGFQYAANDTGWAPINPHFDAYRQPYTPPGQLQPSFTQTISDTQVPYGLANSLSTGIGGRRGREILNSTRSAPPSLGLEEDNNPETEEATPTPAPRRKRTKLGNSKGCSRRTEKTASRVTKSRRAGTKRTQKQGPSTSTRTKRYDFIHERQEHLDNGTADQIAEKVQEALEEIAPLAPSGPVPSTRAELNDFLESFWSRGGLAAAMAPPIATWEELGGNADTSTAVGNSIEETDDAVANMDDTEYDYGDEDVFDESEVYDDDYPAEGDEDTPGEYVNGYYYP
ncbi:hypothetical protein HII31_09051 [Pseudocercospora fuligena]|uniref:Uncharacterized protein n=1 Tax=Pseudocercospora fuligena TaxID=685502 RepID=A0A8H6RFL5_9PEZI|nr:hypothetical protein HII31_09051 [Pseudocercospora fuligena]